MIDQLFIGYPGGFGGDILATLIICNYDSSVSITPRIDKWGFRNRYLSPAKFSSVGKNLTQFLEVVANINTPLKNRYQLDREQFFGNVIKTLYSESPDTFVDNIEKHLRLFTNPSSYNIIPIHYYRPPAFPYTSLSLDRVLNGCCKIRLVCEPRYVPLFMGLARHKTNTFSHLFDLDATSNKGGIKERVDRLAKDLSLPMPGFIDMDVGKMWLEGGVYITETEQRLTDLLHKKIDLKRGFVDGIYIPHNTDILELIFGTDFINNSYEKNVELLVKYSLSR